MKKGEITPAVHRHEDGKEISNTTKYPTVKQIGQAGPKITAKPS